MLVVTAEGSVWTKKGVMWFYLDKCWGSALRGSTDKVQGFDFHPTKPYKPTVWVLVWTSGAGLSVEGVGFRAVWALSTFFI